MQNTNVHWKVFEKIETFRTKKLYEGYLSQYIVEFSILNIPIKSQINILIK